MNAPEAQAAWRLYHYNWTLVGTMAVALLAARAISGFSIAPLSALKPAAIIGAYIGYAYFSHCRQAKRDTRVTFIPGSTGPVLLMPVLITPLAYTAASAARRCRTPRSMPSTASWGSTGWRTTISFTTSTGCCSSLFLRMA